MSALSQCVELLEDLASEKQKKMKTGRCSGPTAPCLWTVSRTWSVTRCLNQFEHANIFYSRHQKRPLKLKWSPEINCVIVFAQQRMSWSAGDYESCFQGIIFTALDVFFSSSFSFSAGHFRAAAVQAANFIDELEEVIDFLFFAENQPLSRNEWDLPQRLAGKKPEPHAEAVS